jgi:RND family efflux transporter MFP subunit
MQTPIALVVNMEKVKIDLDIPEKYLPKITLGAEAKISVDAYPEEEFLGVATKISPVVDLATRTAPIEISLDNPGQRLQSGMFARVKLIIQARKNVPVVLKEAIMGKEPDLYAYAVEDKKATLKKVVLGIRQGPYYEVQEGLKDGDAVVIMGQQRLHEGAPVEPEE